MFDWLFKLRARKLAIRRHYRLNGVTIDAKIACEGHFIPVTMRDVSQRGARTHVPHGHPPTNTVWLHWHGFEKMARVAWSNDDECGLHFASPLSLEELDKILAAQEEQA